MKSPQPNSQMPLLEFLAHHVRRSTRHDRIEKAVGTLERMLNRTPIVADLNAETQARFREHVGCTATIYRLQKPPVKYFTVLWRAAGKLGLVSPKPVCCGFLESARPGRFSADMLSEALGGTAPPPTTPPKLKTSLEVFIRLYYRSKTGDCIGVKWRNHLLRVAEILGELLKRPAIVKDLNVANEGLLRRVIWAAARPAHAKLWAFAAIWRSAAGYGLCPDPGPHLAGATKPRGREVAYRLTEEPGTLWDLCQKRYFPTNLAIRTTKTKHQYACALRSFAAFLDRQPQLADLEEDVVLSWMASLRDAIAPKTINERRGRLCALWNWAAKKRLVHEFPAIKKVKEPKRIPSAWMPEDLAKLYSHIRSMPGRLGLVSASDFWLALHCVMWDTGERIGAVLAIEWDWLDSVGRLIIPAEARKGGDQDMAYRLHADTLKSLERLRVANQPRVFNFPYTEAALYDQYGRILRDAELPHDRNSKFHRMRKSVASYLQAAGVSAAAVLGHSSPEVTRKSYLDPRIVKAPSPSEVLFRPGA